MIPTLSPLTFPDRSEYYDDYKYPYRLIEDPPFLADIFCKLEGSDIETFYKDVRQELTDNPKMIPIVLGKNEDEELIIADLAGASNNMLIAGNTGSGKTNLLYQIILALILNTHSKYCNISIIDHSKGVFNRFKDHVELVKGEKEIISFFKELHKEMLQRFELVRDVDKLHFLNEAKAQKGELIPFKVVVFDEFAVLKDEEALEMVQEIASNGRSAGICLVFATQRPCSKLIDSTIKAHFTSTICLRVSNRANELIILDRSDLGAKQLKRGQALAVLDEIQKVESHLHLPQDVHKILEMEKISLASS